MRVDELKQGIDVRHLIEHDLGKARTGGSDGSKAWAWKCPMHHETKGFSLTAWADGWKCWGACQVGGDAIKWLETYHGLSFLEACRILGAPDEAAGRPKRRSYEPALPAPAEPPDAAWQTLARAVILKEQTRLWSAEAKRARMYLRIQRGLWFQTIEEAHLGYVPGDTVRGWDHYKLPDGRRFDVPHGILIPWITDGQVWGIKVRRGGGDLKYVQVAGSKISGGGLYWADNLLPGWPALFVEGEFDCLVAWQEGMDLLCPVSLGACSNRLNPRWYPKLIGCSPLLIGYDVDEAGDNGAQRLAGLTARARRVKVPIGKDLTDFHRTGTRITSPVHQWFTELLSIQQERNIA